MQDIDRAARAASARLQHVLQRSQELAYAIEAWVATDPIAIKVTIADDRLSWEGRWQVSEPPFDQWALIFGDAAHHLRATLDNLVHFIADQEGATPRDLHIVQFPIALQDTKWGNAKRSIAMLPQPVRSAVEAVQPFQRPEHERASDGLAILSGLNNADKHRIILVCLVQPQTFEHAFAVEFEVEPLVAGPPRTEFFADVINGGPAIRHDTRPDRIANVKGRCGYGAQVLVVDESGHRWGMTSVLAALAEYVPSVLDYVLRAWTEGGPASR